MQKHLHHLTLFEMMKKNNKFLPLENFSIIDDNSYNLLPFNFINLDNGKELLVNLVGDSLVLPCGTVEAIINRNINKSNPLYKELLSCFFISDSINISIIDLLANRYRTLKSFLDTLTGLHIFVLTLRCDQTCHYCQVSRVTEDRNSFDLSKSNIDRAIDLMMISPNPHVTMEFQGGEPLLAFDNLVYAVEQAYQKAIIKNKTIRFVICTNLSLINETILAFCKKYDILISTSLDGPEYVHNQNRINKKGNGYNETVKGIELCRSYLGYDKVSALMTTSNLSLEHPKVIIDDYIKNGFNNIFLRAINPFGFALKNEIQNRYEMSRFIDFYKIALNYILELNKSGTFFIEDYAKIILSKILTPFPVGFVDLQSPAGIINSVIVYNYDGGVYVSDEARMLAEMGDHYFKLGDLSNNSYLELFSGPKAEEIAQAWATEYIPGCANCAISPFCGADPVRNYSTQGNMIGFRPTNSFCQKNMSIIKYLFELLEDDVNRKIFYSWIN